MGRFFSTLATGSSCYRWRFCFEPVTPGMPVVFDRRAIMAHVCLARTTDLTSECTSVSHVYLLLEQKGLKLMMSPISQSIVNFLKREDGPTAVEYAVMLALIIVVCIAAITTLGSNANSTFNTVASTLG